MREKNIDREVEVAAEPRKIVAKCSEPEPEPRETLSAQDAQALASILLSREVFMLSVGYSRSSPTVPIEYVLSFRTYRGAIRRKTLTELIKAAEPFVAILAENTAQARANVVAANEILDKVSGAAAKEICDEVDKKVFAELTRATDKGVFAKLGQAAKAAAKAKTPKPKKVVKKR